MNIFNFLFFPSLQRRKEYRKKSKGSYYDYSYYRDVIRADCKHRCIYCDAHENEIGGDEAMELDHFRPKSISAYNHLHNDPNNLVIGCRRCNNLKGNKWPAQESQESFVGDSGFIDPFQHPRHEFFRVSQNGELIPLKPPAKYLVDILELNRQSRRKLRELRLQHFDLIQQLEQKANDLKKVLENTPELSLEGKEEINQAINIFRAESIRIHENNIRFLL